MYQTLVKNIEGLDSRSIGLFRILLGLLLIYNFIEYRIIPAPEYFLPSNGIFGNEYLDKDQTDKFWSIFKWIRNDIQFYISVIVTLIVYLIYTIGFKSKYFGFIAYFFFWQWNQRFYIFEVGWDKYLGAMLFMSMFLPLSHQYSVDNRISKEKSFIAPFEDKSPFAFIMLMQIGVIYFFSALHKNGNLWMNGEAVKYLLADFTLARGPAEWLLQHEVLYRAATYFTLIIEFAIIFFLFIPCRMYLRILAALSIIGLHWSINLFSDIGHFKYVAICVGVLLIPSSFWNKLFKTTTKIRNSVLYRDSLFKWLYAGIAILMIWVLWINNFYRLGEKDTRVGNLMKSSGIQSVLNALRIPAFSMSSWMNQGWSYYAPDPKEFAGVMGINIYMINGDSRQVLPPPSFSEGKPPYQLNYTSNLEKYFITKTRLLNTNGYKNLRFYWAQRKVENYCLINNIPASQIDKIELVFYFSLLEEVYSLKKMTIYPELDAVLKPIQR